MPIPRPCRDHRPHKHTLVTYTERGEKRRAKGRQGKVTHAERKGLSLRPRILFSSFPIPRLCKMMSSRWDCAMLSHAVSTKLPDQANLFSSLEKARCREPDFDGVFDNTVYIRSACERLASFPKAKEFQLPSNHRAGTTIAGSLRPKIHLGNRVVSGHKAMDILSGGGRGPDLAAGSDFVSPRASVSTWGTHYRKRLSCFCKFYQKIEPQESITRTLPGS